MNKLSKKLLAILSTYPAAVLAGPSGGDVVGGAASISSPSAQGTVINQTSAKVIINWQSFSIAGDEYVQFNQPDSSSVTLNRVTGGDPSNILGNLSANGQVFLVNPNGVYFGTGATLDVGGLVASTMDIRDEDFMNGNYQFTSSNNGTGASVVNDGIIRARENGYVVLAGDRVENNGTIEAKYGKIALLSGGEVSLDIEGDNLVTFSVDAATATELAGVENTGDLIADGGRVVLTGKTSNALVATAVNNSGLIQAHGIAEQNGVIFLTGEGGDISNSGTLDASGTISGDGGAVIVRTDGDAELTSTSYIDASGDGTGAGGVVRVIADGNLQVRSGSLINAASGSAASALGGFVEVSGHEGLLLADDTVSLGSGGTLLIDPANVDIVLSGAGADQINVDTITTQLVAGNDVFVVATDSINLNTAINATGTGGLTVGIGAIAGGTACGGSSCAYGAPTFTPSTGGTINLNNNNIIIDGDLSLTANGGTINGVSTLEGENVTLTANTINSTQSFVSIRALAGTAGNLTINGNLNATANSVEVELRADNNVTINGNINATATSSYGGAILSIGGRDFGTASTSLGSADAAGTVTTNGVITVTGGTAGAAPHCRLNFLTSGDVNINANASVTGGGKTSINIAEYFGEGSAGAVSATGAGLLTAANVSVRSSGIINLKTNANYIEVNGDGNETSAGNISIDNTAHTSAATIQLGADGFDAGIVKLGFGGNGTVNGALFADAISVDAAGDLTMTDGFDVGAGYSGVEGDQALIDFVAANGISDGNGTANPNASFVSGGTLNVDVDFLSQSNRYLYLKADTLNISGTSNAPNLLVQMLPFTETNSIGFDATSPGAQVTNYTESEHFSKFTGTTIGLGGVTHAGGITIGANGGINIGSKNLVFLTGTPFVQGVDNVTGTGVIGVIASVFPEVLLEEVGGSNPGDTGGGDGGEGGDGIIVVEGGGVKDNLNLSCS